MEGLKINMLEIIRITDLNGNPKNEYFEHIKTDHSVYGEFVIAPEEGMSFFFKYYDENSATLVSSKVKEIEYIESDKLYIITTKNSIYYIKEV